MTDLFGSTKCSDTELFQCLEFALKLSKLPGPLIDDDFRGFDEYSGKVKTKVARLTIWCKPFAAATRRIHPAIGKLLDELPILVELPECLRYALIGYLLQCQTQKDWNSASRQLKLLAIWQRHDFLRMEAFAQHNDLTLDDLQKIGFTNIHPRFIFRMVQCPNDTLIPKSELPAGLHTFSYQIDILQKALERIRDYQKDKPYQIWSWDRFMPFVEQLYQETGQYLGYCFEHPNLIFYAKEKELSLVTWLVRALDVPLSVAIRTARHQIFPGRHWLDSFLVQIYNSANIQ